MVMVVHRRIVVAIALLVCVSSWAQTPDPEAERVAALIRDLSSSDGQVVMLAQKGLTDEPRDEVRKAVLDALKDPASPVHNQLMEIISASPAVYEFDLVR